MGYESDFLGPELPLPASSASAGSLAELDYTHFTVVLDRRRKLAELTGVNIDGGSLLDLPRGDDWHLDDRLPSAEQTGPEVYARNDLDRGHLVRRRDPVWGPDAAQANDDTFSYANAAPQVNVFNQSKELWLGLEDYILGNADSTDRRLSVFTGPVLGDGDREYRGVQVPRMFWKIAAWAAQPDVLACTAYLLDQGALLDDLDPDGVRRRTVAPELGAFRTFQVAVDEIGALTGLSVGQLSAVDRFEARTGALPDDAESVSRTELRGFADIRL